jgi:hypothetical protein
MMYYELYKMEKREVVSSLQLFAMKQKNLSLSFALRGVASIPGHRLSWFSSVSVQLLDSTSIGLRQFPSKSFPIQQSFSNPPLDTT